MKRWLLILGLLLVITAWLARFPWEVYAQNPGPVFVVFTSPSGNKCAAPGLWIYALGGTVYSCQNGTITLVSGGGTVTTHSAFRATCYGPGAVSGSNFDSNASVGTLAAEGTGGVGACDNDGIDGTITFATGATNHKQFHIFLPSTWKDPVKFTIAQLDTSATSGSATFGVALQCAGNGTAYSSSGYGSYTTFSAVTASGTGYLPLQSNTISITTGCTAGQTLYGDLELTSGNNTTGAAVNVNWLDAAVTW